MEVWQLLIILFKKSIMQVKASRRMAPAWLAANSLLAAWSTQLRGCTGVSWAAQALKGGAGGGQHSKCERGRRVSEKEGRGAREKCVWEMPIIALSGGSTFSSVYG